MAFASLLEFHNELIRGFVAGGQKVDVFYLAGLLLYLGIFLGIQHASRAPTSGNVTTETRTQSSLRIAGTATIGEQTSTSRSTTQP